MQLPSNVPVISGLTRLYAAHLRRHYDCNVRGLDRRLLTPLQPRRNPRNQLSPAEEPPYVFERTWAGKWPDNNNYCELDKSGKRFNLVERVEEHLPGSRDWLCEWLRRPALKEPHRMDEIAADIELLCARLGIRRLHPWSAWLLCLHDDALEHLRPMQVMLMLYRHPVTVSLLTLWFVQINAQSRGCGYLSHVWWDVRMAWMNLLGLPGLFAEPDELAQARRQADLLLRTITANQTQIWPGPFAKTMRSRYGYCGFWRPNQNELDAEERLAVHCRRYISDIAPSHQPISGAPPPDFLLDRKGTIDLATVLHGLRASARRCREHMTVEPIARYEPKPERRAR